MSKETLVTYIKDGLKKGNTVEDLTDALVQNGWPEKDVKSAALIATAPKSEYNKSVPAPPTPPDNSDKAASPQKNIKKIIPDHYTSPLSILLSIVLFFATVSLTGQILTDITNIFAPYAPPVVEQTIPYQKALDEGKELHRDSPLYQELSQNHDEKHVSHRANSLLINALASIVFWLLAFAIHFLIGQKRKQFTVLSAPFFIVAILYLFILLRDTLSILFATESIYAIYITLILIAAATTGSFIFYQKHKH